MTRFSGVSARSRVVPALAVAASVLVFTVAVQTFMSLLYFAMSLFQGQGLDPAMLGEFVAPIFVLTVFAFSLGVFAWLWLCAPITADQRLRGVVTGSLIAVAAGAVLAFVVEFGIQMQSWFSNANFFSNSLNQATESFLRDGGNAFGSAVSSSIQLAVGALPLTVLAVVLTWIWLVRHSAHSVEAATQIEV